MPPAPLTWQVATVEDIRPETAKVKTFRLQVPGWPSHRPGQHVDIRLTAADGYEAQRSYSIASPATSGGRVDLTIERIADGEVSPYFHDVLVVGDQVEVRGPIGGYFVWEPTMTDPLLLVAGGSGVVPLMAILRERASHADAPAPAVLLASWRTIDDVIYRHELERLAGSGSVRVLHTLTRVQPPGWDGYARRIDRPMLTDALAGLGEQPSVYVCGPTLLVESAAASLVDLGVAAARIRTERFGPTS